jgi:hypothetical protein
VKKTRTIRIKMTGDEVAAAVESDSGKSGIGKNSSSSHLPVGDIFNLTPQIYDVKLDKRWHDSKTVFTGTHNKCVEYVKSLIATDGKWFNKYLPTDYDCVITLKNGYELYITSHQRGQGV